MKARVSNIRKVEILVGENICEFCNAIASFIHQTMKYSIYAIWVYFIVGHSLKFFPPNNSNS